ncbi:MAG TPA: hypothetical protein EYG86_00405 [Crocinitomicaceae bacterium]|nr:hypothetical protein [Crocinitomicaceae bacterium]
MKLFAQILISSLIVFILFSCKKDAENEDSQFHSLRGIVQPVFGAGNNLYLDSIYTTQEGYDIQFKEIQFFVQDIKFGSLQLVKTALFDYRSSGVDLFRLQGTTDNLDSIVTLKLGIDSISNHQNPSTFHVDNLLHTFNSSDMYWDTNKGYFFVKIEALVDTVQDGTPLFDHSVIYHVGLDANIQSLSFNNFYWSPQGVEDVLPLYLDMQAFLAGPQVIDVKIDSVSQSDVGQEILTAKVMGNFAAAIAPF